MTVSVFDHPFLSGLLGDEDIADLFSAKADIDAMLAFEAALSAAEGAEGLIPADAADAIGAELSTFRPDVAALRDGVARDGVAVPELVRQLRAAIGKPHDAHVHSGATSQDVVDTSLAIRLAKALGRMDGRLDGLIAALEKLEQRDGAIDVMAHTRMQAAIPVTAARKIASWRDPLIRHLDRLTAQRDEVCVLHLGGAAGTVDKLGGKEAAIAERMAKQLGLRTVTRPVHNERDGPVSLASWLSLVTGSLGKMGQDIALMTQSEIGEVKLASTGGSSAMPHKHNPVAAEVLVTLARFNATLVSGMHQAMVHENERSGIAWTLEWMLLPQMVVAAGAALRIAADLVDGISFQKRN